MTIKKCPSCGYFTFEGDYDICEVCYWQYVAVAQDMPDRVIVQIMFLYIKHKYKNLVHLKRDL
ncbi:MULTISPECIES: CPCC family cysteine-rich protein [Lysinibacillus]|uniref:CPCC family cysteine-rich protein n=1 Tax=Lysinibacillus TaxID=400634 RepID=UPI00257C832C|nr:MULTISPECIES: CPCC family cysteine-rich protein [Lysinibacillus]